MKQREEKRLGGVFPRLLAAAQLPQAEADLPVVDVHDVVPAQQRDRRLILPQNEVAARNVAAEGNLADLLVGVLLQERDRARVQRLCAANQRGVAALKAGVQKDCRALKDDGKGIRVVAQRPLCLGHRLVVALLLAQRLDARSRFTHAALLPAIAQQHVDRRAEELRQLRQQLHVGAAAALLPLADRANRHAHRLRKLLLRQAARLAQGLNVLSQPDLHALSPFCLHYTGAARALQRTSFLFWKLFSFQPVKFRRSRSP